jgi:hypothetical protein
MKILVEIEMISLIIATKFENKFQKKLCKIFTLIPHKVSIIFDGCKTGMGRNNIDESNDLFKYEKIACQG